MYMYYGCTDIVTRDTIISYSWVLHHKQKWQIAHIPTKRRIC